MMRTTTRVLLLAAAAVGGPLAMVGVSGAATPSVATAPGRVVIALNGGLIDETDSSGGSGGPAVALPDGGIVAVGAGPAGVARVIELTARGAPDPSFGAGGVVTITPALPAFGIDQIVRQPDGKLVLLGNGGAVGGFEHPQLVAYRLNADGTPDPSFGDGGVDLLPIEGIGLFALTPGGGFVVGGETGLQATPITTNPLASPQWVVAELTSNGALDPGFGTGGIATVAGNGAFEMGVAVLPNGDVVTEGDAPVGPGRSVTELTRLLPTGAPDPAFNGGTPQTLPAVGDGGLLAYPDGKVIVGVPHGIVRYTAAGLPDQGFGSGGVVQTGPPDTDPPAQILAAPGDGALIVVEGGNEYAMGHDRVERILGTGAFDPALGGQAGLAFTTPFGGGSSGLLTTLHPQPLGPLDQNDFSGTVLERPDGSFVQVGGVAVSQPTGEGTGRSVDEFAAIALTPTFRLDTAFGGPAAPLTATVVVLNQRAATARKRHGIRVTLNVSAPGLARVVIKAAGRVVAQNLLPVLAPARTILPVELTNFGNRWLKSHPRGNLTVSLKARDLLTNTATATTGPVRLR